MTEEHPIKPAQKPKARAPFCWECGRKLPNKISFTEIMIDGHPRILHKQCAKDIQDGIRTA